MGIITSVQMTFSLLMALAATCLCFLLPRFTNRKDQAIKYSRYLLVTGCVLVGIHFLIQYVLHSTGNAIPVMRTAINMLFAVPCGFCFNISLLVLQRNEMISTRELLWFILDYFMVMLVLLIPWMAIGNKLVYMYEQTIIMSQLFAISLLYANVLQLKEYRRIKRLLKNEKNERMELLMMWTKWSMFLMLLVGVGLPFITFSENLTARSVYGIFTIISAFVYIFCFMGYSISCSVKRGMS